MTRRVLVTGGSRGIGLAIARGCAAGGDAVVVLSRRPPPDGLAHLPCDLRSPAMVREVLSAWIDAEHGAVDALVHCAVGYGSSGRHPLLASTVAEWDEAMEVNARGLLLAVQAVLPGMLRRRQGVIVGISSDVAVQPGPGRVPYAASKAAAHAVMVGLAAELTGSGVSAVELLPTGQVDTPGIRSRRPADFAPVGYAEAKSFVAPVRWLLAGNAARHHGGRLLVDPAGRLVDAGGVVVG